MSGHWPVPLEYGITSAFGIKGAHWKACGYHTGADFAAPVGTPIYAPEDDDIRYRDYGAAFGDRAFALSPDAPHEWFFAHCETRLPNGTRVKRGQKIGTVGNRGNSTGPHLHLEWHAGKSWTCSGHRDPAKYLTRIEKEKPVAGPVRIKVATANAPHRLKPHTRAWQWMDSQGVDIICAQEHADADDWRPSKTRWGRHRPKRAQSNTIYFRHATIKKLKGGAIRLSSPGFSSYRDLVWAHFRVKKGGGKPIRVAGIHLPAFKTSKPKNAVEFRKQEPKAARWLRNGKNRVMGGDFNATLPSKVWTSNLSAAGAWSKGVASGPKGQKIDYVGVRKKGTWKVVKTERGPKFDSDHHIVIVTLEWVG